MKSLPLAQELVFAARALLAALLGAFVGWQRQITGKEVGIRTYATVALGACTFGLISVGIEPEGRIAAQVVTGVGFIGAGVILHQREHIHGLTTAASLWTSASVGLAIAYGMYLLGAAVALLSFILLSIRDKPEM